MSTSINNDMAVPIKDADSEGREDCSVDEVEYESENLSGPHIDVPPARRKTKKHRRIVKVTGAAGTCLDGHYLPLLTDKIRNNVRSRPLLVGMYMVGTAFVSVLLVIAFSFTEPSTLAFTMPVKPPTTLYLGEIASPFAAQVRNHDLEGVSGMICVAATLPIAPFDIEVDVGSGLFNSRTINCLESMLEPGGINTYDDFLFCIPSLYPGGLDPGNRMVVTNSKGMCTFTSFTIGFGTEGTYLILIILVDPKIGAIVNTVTPQTFFTTVKSGMLSITPLSSNVFLPFGSPQGFPIGMEGQFDANLTAEIVLSGSSPTAVLATTCGAIISLNLQRATGQPAAVVEPAVDTMDKSIQFASFSNVACTSNFTKDENGNFRGLLTWSKIVVIGANSRQLYFGISSQSMTIPLNTISTPSYYPTTIVFSVSLWSNVSSVHASGMPPNISETSTLDEVTVTVRDKLGKPLQNRLVFLAARPSPGPPIFGNAALLSPYVAPKHIMFGIGETNESGIATFHPSFFSSGGGVGVYEVFASCDGTVAHWSSSTSPSSSSSSFTKVLVTSAADAPSILYEFIGGDLSVVETVGVPWAVVPIVRISARAGTNIPGKVVDVRSLDPTVSAGVTKVVPSGNDGTAYVVSYVSSFVNSGVPNVPVIIQYHLVVDEIVVLTFNRTLVAPAATANACMYVQVLDPLPQKTYTGLIFVVKTRAVTGVGSPVAGTTVTFSVSSDFITPQPGQNSTVLPNTTDSSGVAYFYINATGVPMQLGIYGILACASSFPPGVTASYNYLAMVLTSRLANVTAVVLNNATLGLQIEPYDWSTVSAAFPIPVTASIQWYPSYASTSYYANDMPIPQTFLVTGPQDSFVQLTMANKPITPGCFGLVFRADTVPFPPFLTFNIVTEGVVVTIEESFAIANADGSPVVLNRGVLLRQPAVRIMQQHANGSSIPLVGHKVFAQLVVNLTNGTTVYQHLGNQREIDLGLVLDSGYRVSQPADVTGLSSFVNLTIMAVLGGAPFSFRYCVGTGVQVGIFSSSFDLCASEDVWAILSPLSSVEYVTSTSVLTGTQGQFLPPITIFAVAKTPMLFFCSVQLLGQPATALIIPQGLGAVSSDNLGSSAVFENFITPATFLSDGVYIMRFMCSGGISNNVSVVFSTVAASISVVLPPPAQSLVQTVTPVLVQLLSPSAQPVSNIYVAAYVSPSDKECILSSCGVLDPTSIVYAQTASDGTALFTFILDRGTTQSLSVIFLEGNQRSELAVSQAARDAYRFASSDYGVPRQMMVAGLKSRVSILGEFLDVMDQIFSASGGWSSSTSLTPTSGVTSGPLQKIQQLFGQVATPASSATIINLVNKITGVVIHSQPSSTSFILPFAVSALSATAAPTPTNFSFGEPFVIEFIVIGGRQAIQIYPLVIDVECDGCDVTVQQQYQPSNDPNSTTVTVRLDFQVTSPCTFRLWFTGLGGGGNYSAMHSVEFAAQVSRTDYMKIIAAFIVVLFSPMLASTVPHANRMYAIVSVFAVALMSGGTWWSQTLLPPDDPFYYAYWIFLVTITTVVSAGFVAVTLLDYLSYKHDFYALRFVNDEGKALKIFDYSQWLINARATRQKQPGDDGEDMPNALERRLSSFVAIAADKINSFAPTDVIDIGSPTRKLRRKCVFQYDHEHLFPAYMPINFLIVVAISLVLLILLNFITVFLYRLFLRHINMFLTYLPSVDENASIDQANAIVIYAISRAIEVTVQQFPQYARLGEIVGPLQSVNLVSLLSQFRELVAEGLLRLEVAFIVASSMAFLVYTGTLATTALAIPGLLKQIRRGSLEVSSSMSSLEGYIGLHCWQLLVVYQIVFWPVAIISFLLSISYVRQFLYDKLLVIVASSVIAFIISFGLNKVFVQRYLCSGPYTVVRNELYSIWHYVGLILGVFTGFMSSVVRWGKSVAFISILFARLDYAIYPELFASADTAHGGFMSVVNVEAKNGNPLYVTFCTLLLLEPELRRLANDTNGNTEVDQIQVSEIFRGSTVASSVRNVARIFVRDLCRAPHDLRDRGAPKHVQILPFRDAQRRAQKERVRHRFWLALLLIHNPSLKALRKHKLYED